MGLGCSNGGPQGEGRLGTTLNAHGSRARGGVPGLGCSRMHIRAGWWTAGVMATAVTRSNS